jgi:tRNA U34 5-carboxymethylaminomethyl modifying enzyme MnmG/GidA
MPYKIVKVGNNFKIKNLKTGKVGKLNYKLRKDAQTQINNRLKYESYISRGNTNNNKNKGKK